MRIGGAARDSLMTVIPILVIVFVAMIFFGGPGDALRSLERFSADVWTTVSTWFRR